MQQLQEIITASETWLVERILFYAKEHGYSQYNSTKIEDWRASIAGISLSLLTAVEQFDNAPPEFNPDVDYSTHPVAAFGIEQARTHRRRGISMTMFLGLLKYYRQSYIDLLNKHIKTGEERRRCRKFIARCFDLFEITLCSEWISLEKDQRIQELQDANRRQTNEKNKYLTLFESISDPIFLVDHAGIVENLNVSAASFMGIGVTPEELSPLTNDEKACGIDIPGIKTRKSVVGRRLSESLPWLAVEIRNFLAQDRRVLRVEKKARCYGEDRYFKITLSSMLDISGKFSGAVVVLADITKQTITEMELVRSRDMMQAVMDGTPALIAYLNKDLQYQFANNYYEEIFETPVKSILGKHVSTLVGDKLYAKVAPMYERALKGERQNFELTFQSPKKGTRNFEITYLPHTFGDSVEGIIILILDLTDRKMAEIEREKFFKLTPGMMCIAGFDGFFKQINPAWTKKLGWSEEELLSRPFIDFVLPDDVNSTVDANLILARGKELIGFENRYRCKDGSFRWITWNATPSLEDKVVYAVAHDTTKRRKMEETLRKLAAKDSLTGTNNRRHFFELGARAFAGAKRYDRALSTFMLDIDHFKRINDTHGHAAGDEVLKILVQTCQDTLRDSDIMGRMGGEEFAVVLPETNASRAFATAERLREKLDKVLVNTQEHEIGFTVSIGVATLESKKDSLEDLLKRADDALYEAKRHGRNRVFSA
ncbi:diguanylate cyclase [Desulfovibrio ferrophilus]|uniref:diguanylate cyclase n=1 Tax=Desulfovibrio ferrophilus TaxID=241368 RepID=A0A2Z6AYE5_9BACT|nr:diguanylate cyclase [Desulfovibrio ferrophilus]BBD08287.1 diguanylate cyclase [Desulfovibrio ferrophilus]